MVIFFVPEDGACAVHLFGQNQAYDLVGKDQFGQTPNEIGAGSYGIIDPICAPNQKNQWFAAFVSGTLHQMGEFGRADIFSPLIQQYQEIVRLQ